MSQPFVGEVRLVGFNFAPAGWNTCNGQLLSIADYSTLFNLIGTTYGGDGQNTFGLPNLQSRVAVHQGTLPAGATYVIGETGGVETVTLDLNQYPAHAHSASVSPSVLATTISPVNNFPGAGLKAYSAGTPTDAMSSSAIAAFGGNFPHSNLQPLLTLNWIISLFGIYPSQG